MTVVVPTLDKLNKEGEQGQKINQWTRYSVALYSAGVFHRFVFGESWRRWRCAANR